MELSLIAIFQFLSQRQLLLLQVFVYPPRDRICSYIHVHLCFPHLFFFKNFYLFIFVCAESTLICGLFFPPLVVVGAIQLWCTDFSLQAFLLLWSTGSRAHRFRELQFSGSRAQAQQLRGIWDLPRPGIEPMSPAWAGRFCTTEPPGKSLLFFFKFEWQQTIYTILFLIFNTKQYVLE